MLANILPSYAYTQYADDANIQAFVSAYNQLAQSYLDTFNGLNLPVYTGLSGALLDWVAAGLYGQIRPSLPVLEQHPDVGAYGTVTYGAIPYGALRAAEAPTYILATDDTFKRCLTWALYKGDGKQYSTRWLKRRVARFLDPDFDQTYRVSVGYGANDAVTIRIVNVSRTITGGAVYGRAIYGRTAYGVVTSTVVTYPPVPAAEQLRAAIETGALELPFHYNYTVQIS